MSSPNPAARALTGPNAASMKYDILSAIGLIGLHGCARTQVSMPRLALLVTARYNWRRHEISMGQSEMARLWGVSERTAKREVKFWLERGLLQCTKPGVRGRVAAYRLDIPAVLRASEPFWPAIGSDFVARMTAPDAPPASEQNVVHLNTRRPERVVADPTDPWAAVKQSLSDAQPEVYSSWLSQLEYERLGATSIRITAPSRFVASYVNGHYLGTVERAIRGVHPEITEVSIVSA